MNTNRPNLQFEFYKNHGMNIEKDFHTSNRKCNENQGNDIVFVKQAIDGLVAAFSKICHVKKLPRKLMKK